LGASRWVRKKCKVLYYGLENIANNKNERRVYISNHPTTFDVHLLLHMSETIIYTFIDAAAYSIPGLGLLLSGAGYIKFVKGKGPKAMERAIEYIEHHKPFLQTLRTGEAILGDVSKPRTGGIRIAYQARANIYPHFLMMAGGKKITKQFRGMDFKLHPLTCFDNILYFVKFLKPIPYEEYAKEKMTHRDYQNIANRIGELFEHEKQKTLTMLKDEDEYFSKLERTGGADYRILY
jgi:1-acyl-sn-glycerol-3-phosphate acyltransferase